MTLQFPDDFGDQKQISDIIEETKEDEESDEE